MSNAPNASANPYQSPDPDAPPEPSRREGLPFAPIRIPSPDEPGAIVAVGETNFDEFVDAVRLDLRGTRWRRLGNIAFFVGLLIVVAVALDDLLCRLALLAMLALIVYSSLVNQFYPRRMALLRWKDRSPVRHPTCREIFTVDGVRISTSTTDGIIAWAEFAKCRCNDICCILYLHGAKSYISIHRSSFHNDGDWQRFLELVEKNVKPA